MVHAPVGRMENICMMLVMAVELDYDIHMMGAPMKVTGDREQGAIASDQSTLRRT